jgi:hypothetical protein
MTLTKPTSDLHWAETGENSEPDDSKKLAGYEQGTGDKGEAPSFRQLNWKFRETFRWVKYLTQEVEQRFDNDHVVVSASQLALNAGTETYQASDQTFRDSEGAIVPVNDGDRFRFVSMDALTDKLVIPGDYITVRCDRGFQIPVNDQKIFFTGDYIEEARIFTNKDYNNGLEAETEEDQRVVKNRGRGNRIVLNGRKVFSGGFPREFSWPTEIKCPYRLLQNGLSSEGLERTGNELKCLFKDLWFALNGIEGVAPPSTTPFASSVLELVFTDDIEGRFLRPVAPSGGLEDPDVHTRVSPSHLGDYTLTSGNYTSAASAEISGITDANIAKFRVGARVRTSNNDIPYYGSGPAVTTIISKIVHNAADDNSIFLIDSETRAAVSVTATGDLTIDFGGNTGISQQTHIYPSHNHTIWAFTSDDGAYSSGQTADPYLRRGTWGDRGQANTSTSGGGGAEVRPKNTQRYYYIEL